MTRWFRFYDDAVNDPKIIKLSDDIFRAWVNLLCVSSKHDGALPAVDDIAIILRVKIARAAVILAELVSFGLLDKTETGFAPHNWNGRQYKSDVSTDRVKRFRNGKRNVSETPPETEAETDTNSEQKDCADAPIDPRKRLFDEGLPKLAAMTGKGPDACRSFVGKCLKASSDDAIVVLGLIEDAERNRVADPSAWIAARLKSTGPPASTKPLTEFQRKQQATIDVTDKLRQSALAERSGGTADRFLPDDHGERPGDLRGGAGSHVLAISGASGRGSG